VVSDSPRDLRDHLAKLSSEILATMVVVLANDAGYLHLDEGHREEMEEVLLADMASGPVERFMADAVGGETTIRPAQYLPTRENGPRKGVFSFRKPANLAASPS
jgi:hypothetical protein